MAARTKVEILEVVNAKCKVTGDMMLAQKLQGVLQDPLFLWPLELNAGK